MKINSCEIKEKSLAELTIEISAERMEEAMALAFRKNKNSIAIPGFRRGKAPRKMIERMFGASIFYNDAIESIMPELAEFIDEKSELKTVGNPSVTDIDMKEDEPEIGAELKVEIAVYPEIKFGEYKGLSAEREEAAVSDEEIDEEIEAVRQRNVRIETVERPAEIGDVVNFDFEGFLEGKPFEGGKSNDYELQLGSNTFIPGFEEKMVGMAAGDERDLDLTFPDQYAEHLAGKPVLFKVKLNEVKEKILPELDDEFAKDISEFDTFKEYRDNLVKIRLEDKQLEADAEFETALMDKILETFDAEVPDAMVKDTQEELLNTFASRLASYGTSPDSYFKMTSTTPEQLFEQTKEQAERRVKAMLVLEKVAELEKIVISAEDVEKEYQENAERLKEDVEKLKENVSEKDVIHDLTLRRAAALIRENAKAIKKKKTSDKGSESKEKKETTSKPKKAAAKPKTKKDAQQDTAVEKTPPVKKTAAKKTATKSADSADTATEKPKKAPAKQKKTANSTDSE